ncbi:MAG: radical SAM protein [Patescibacteria group bacterium]|nr:radical SAM protein [Patescibacteria group bacterium]
MIQVFKKLNRYFNNIEIILGRLRLLSGPQDAQIEPTNRCNQRCIMCPRTDKLDVPIGDLSFDDFKKILNKLPTIRNLQLNGLGEPLLNSQLPEMISYASSKGISVSINSNCALINQSLAEKLINSGLRLLKISMDSSDPEVYRVIRGASIERTLEGIKILVKKRKEKKANLPRIWFNSIIMKQNYKEMPDILRLAENLEIDFIRFKPVDIFDLYQDRDLLVEQNELKKTITKTLELTKNTNVKHNLNELLEDFNVYYRPKEKIPCYSPWRELYIQYYGGVRLCCEFYSRKDDIGNILEEDFQKIWNGSRMRGIRKEFKKGNTFFPVCQSCNRFQKNVWMYKKIKRFNPCYSLN